MKKSRVPLHVFWGSKCYVKQGHVCSCSRFDKNPRFFEDGLSKT